LVVDDDFSTRELLSLVLAGDGYRVAMACNGLDALERLRDFELPDLMIIDLKMPKMDGCAFCEQRRRDDRWVAIPLIVLSGVADGADKAGELGATAYMQKPIDPIHVLETVRKHCPVGAVACPSSPRADEPARALAK
jgi:twitching motility two-component system response regulator PilH